MAFGRNVQQDWDRDADWLEHFYPQVEWQPLAAPERVYYDAGSGVTVVSRLGWQKALRTRERRQIERVLELFHQLLEAQSTRAVLLFILAAWLCAVTGKIVGG